MGAGVLFCVVLGDLSVAPNAKPGVPWSTSFTYVNNATASATRLPFIEFRFTEPPGNSSVLKSVSILERHLTLGQTTVRLFDSTGEPYILLRDAVSPAASVAGSMLVSGSVCVAAPSATQAALTCACPLTRAWAATTLA